MAPPLPPSPPPPPPPPHHWVSAVSACDGPLWNLQPSSHVFTVEEPEGISPPPVSSPLGPLLRASASCSRSPGFVRQSPQRVLRETLQCSASAEFVARVSGIPTMAKLPFQETADGLDAAFVGVPIDTGTSNRPGARFGPRHIRVESAMLRQYNSGTRAAPYESLMVADIGDVNVNVYDLKDTCKRIREAYRTILATGCIPLTMGGDHTIAYPILQAVAERHGPVGLVHVDAHADTSDVVLGEKIGHGTPFRRCVEEGLLDCKRVVQIGLRGSGYSADSYEWSRAQGFRVVQAEECWFKSLEPLMAEIAGLTPIQGVEIIRGCRGLNLVGCDLVEVSPPYDTTGNTALTGANLLFEMLCVLPKVPAAVGRAEKRSLRRTGAGQHSSSSAARRSAGPRVSLLPFAPAHAAGAGLVENGHLDHQDLWTYPLLILSCQLVTVTQASKVWGEVPLPEDLESKKDVQASPSLLDDDEDFAADEASGDLPSGEDDGSTPWPPESTIYYRALVNFTDSLVYSPELEDIYSPAFNEISEAVVDTLESEYNRIPGVQTVSVVLIKKMVREDGVDVFVELDVGSDYNSDGDQIRSVLYSVVKEGAIASYVTSVQGFQFRRLGEVTPSIRSCMPDEHRCGDGTCILMEYLCDNRLDCRDMSDETNCVKLPTPPVYTTAPTTTTTARKSPRPPSPPGPCRADQATCQSGECISRDYICDGERDCSDGSDEFRCGTPSPCEPNEFKCRNGRAPSSFGAAMETTTVRTTRMRQTAPPRVPGDRCAPEQFECLGDRSCIPASYQCDEEPDCPDRSDEYGCTPPSVTSPPEESVQAARGGTVTFSCQAVGVPTPIITWRLNWGHIHVSGRISMTSENGRGTLTIRDVKEADQGAYTCEAINAKGLVFGIPDGVLTLISNPNSGDCPDGQFSVEGRCVSCFCSGITKNCKRTGRYRNRITLRFTDEDDFRGVEVTYPSRPGIPPLSSTQLIINPEMEEFQLVDLSRRFLNLDSFWTLPRQFLGNKIDSYGGSLKYKVRFTLARGLSDPVEKPDVILVGNGRRLVYRRGSATPAREVNQKEIKFTEDKWQHSNGRTVSRDDLMMTLANLDSVSIRTIYDDHMVSVALSDIIMDTTSVEFSIHGHAKDVEECRCSPGYTGLSCEMCSSGFERVPGGSYLGTCAGCNCNGHASACDPINGHCLSCQHNTEGPQCDKCRSGYFGDPSRGRPDDCKPCPCPYYETSRRFSDTCFLDVDQQPTCDACRPGYTGRRCDKCASGYHGNPVVPNGKCVPNESSKCDNRGTLSSSGRPCSCKNNVAGAVCDECKSGFFHLSEANPEGCLRCFCMGVTKQCASSTWNRDQVRGGSSVQLFSLSNSANTNTISEGITQRGFSEIVYRSFSSIPSDVYFWVLPESFRGDKVTAYGGELRYAVRFAPYQRSQMIDGQPDVVLQGNGIFLEHYSQIKPLPRVQQTITVTFRESAWRRADGQPCTREHLLMALADISLFMIRASYADKMDESSISDIKMDVAVPHSTGNDRALEVEECACPQGYRGPSCQECDEGYTRTSSGLYLGTCERCDCNGHAAGCDLETGRCLQCLHNTDGPRCERCQSGFYGNPVTGSAQACQPCPCPGTTTSNQFSQTCHLESDGQPTCDTCPQGYTGRRCERALWTLLSVWGVTERARLAGAGTGTNWVPSEEIDKTSIEEKPSADSCGDPFLEKLTEGFLPVGCGTEAVFNFSWEKEIIPYGSGDDEDDGDDDMYFISPVTTVIPTRTLLSTAAIRRTPQSTIGVGTLSVTSSRSTSRLPPRFTPSLESRHTSFQRLLRIHLNTFNQRLSMLESNTLDMKESIRSIHDQQGHLSSQLKELISIQSDGEKNKKVGELEIGYTDMGTRLSRLEGRLEILIDGFTALAQEMNKMKRPNQTRSKKVKDEATITKFQLEPPPHKSKSAGVPQLRKQSDQANKKDSALPIKNNRRDKVFRSDAPVPKTVPESGKSSKGVSKTSSESQRSKLKQHERKLRNSYNLASRKSKNSIQVTTTTTKPTVSTTAKKSRTKVKTTTTAQTKVTTGKKKVTTTAKRKSTPSKTKSADTAKKVAKKLQQKKTAHPRSGILDLLRLLKGDTKSSKHKTNQDGSLHVVLGRLAIPIKIIPDD
ncbi:unnamed protein product [Pleuronectes platessa]|uniref:Basement membrane-specific heparan sulfate proteoglycan core protein n=1 Tax=Pleuronectes platessa TaxID=8262 RepID=A0A9N7U8M5_PLEPL|nr:unnamed protein product [Pleuronectes platessa]